MLEEIIAGRDPTKKINVLKAARFCIEASKYQVSSKPCANCFIKFGVLGPAFGPSPRPKNSPNSPAENSLPDDHDAEADIYSMVSELQRAGRIRNAMQVTNFLEPAGK
jgi:hypothetical protein